MVHEDWTVRELKLQYAEREGLQVDQIVFMLNGSCPCDGTGLGAIGLTEGGSISVFTRPPL
jgi:hypothetical protein